jgi:hypothetical protein
MVWKNVLVEERLVDVWRREELAIGNEDRAPGVLVTLRTYLEDGRTLGL